MTANLVTLTKEQRAFSMNRDLMPATTLTAFKKIAFTLLYCTVLMVFPAPAQTIQSIKADPGHNNPPPAGAILDLSGTPIPGGGNNTYQQYSVKFTATLASTAITFAFREDPAFISFSSASVTDLTHPSGNLLLNGDFSLGPINNNPPTDWTYADVFGVQAAGVVNANCGVGFDGGPIYGIGNCWFDGAVQAYDAISQPISTNVGDTYQITFWVADSSGCGTCNFSDLSTNGDITDTGGNGINVTVYAQGGVPEVTVTQQGAGMDQTGAGLTQTFTLNGVSGQQVEFDFDFSPGFNLNHENLTVQPGTTPFVGFTGIPPLQYQALVKNTALDGTFCPTALGLKDSTGATQCVLNTLTATTTANNVASGANLPTDNSLANTRDILFTQVFDLDPASLPPTVPPSNMLIIPSHTAPGIAEFNDFGTCPYPVGDPLYGTPCPHSILTSIQDGPTKPGGTGHPVGFGGIFFCCEPEWTTQPTIPLWTNNAASIPVSFLSNPPTSTSPTFHAAQGLGVSFGAVARGVAMDPTFSYPTEQTAPNPIPCPNSPLWSAQVPAIFTATGTLTLYDSAGTGTSFVEGAYDLLFAPLDCVEFLGLQYPPSIEITGTPKADNLAQWNRVPFNVDTTSPKVTVTLSATGPIPINSLLTASVTCMDPLSNGFFSGIAKCGSLSAPQTFPGNPQTETVNNIPVPTNVAGPQMFTAMAQDVAGNLVTLIVNYTVVYQSADMDLFQYGPLFVKSGNNATYNMLVWNAGPSQAYNVVVSDTVPNGETLQSANVAVVTGTIFGCPPPPSGSPSCGLSGNTATCTVPVLPAIPNGAKSFSCVSVKLVTKVNAPPGTLLKNTATVNASNPNTDKDNSFPWFTLVTK